MIAGGDANFTLFFRLWCITFPSFLLLLLLCFASFLRRCFFRNIFFPSSSFPFASGRPAFSALSSPSFPSQHHVSWHHFSSPSPFRVSRFLYSLPSHLSLPVASTQVSSHSQVLIFPLSEWELLIFPCFTSGRSFTAKTAWTYQVGFPILQRRDLYGFEIECNLCIHPFLHGMINPFLKGCSRTMNEDTEVIGSEFMGSMNPKSTSPVPGWIMGENMFVYFPKCKINSIIHRKLFKIMGLQIPAVSLQIPAISLQIPAEIFGSFLPKKKKRSRPEKEPEVVLRCIQKYWGDFMEFPLPAPNPPSCSPKLRFGKERTMLFEAIAEDKPGEERVWLTTYSYILYIYVHIWKYLTWCLNGVLLKLKLKTFQKHNTRDFLVPPFASLCNSLLVFKQAEIKEKLQ